MLKRLNVTVREVLEKKRLCFLNCDANPDASNNVSTCKFNVKLISCFQKFICSYKYNNAAEHGGIIVCATENANDDQRQDTWRTNPAHLEHTGLSFLGWSTALVIAWCTSQPIYRKCMVNTNTEKWMYTSMSDVITTTAFAQPVSNRDGTQLHPDKTDSDSYQNAKHGHSAVQENTARVAGWYTVRPPNQKDAGVTGYVPSAIVLNETKKSVTGSGQSNERNVKHGPLTAQEALDEAADNLAQVQNRVAGDIENKLGTKSMKLGRHADAVFHFNQAIKLGNQPALFNMAICYELGLGTEKNLSEAVRYYKLASDRGHAAATYNLGVFHLLGNGGLQKDLICAWELFERASALGQKEAKEALRKISSYLQKTEQEENRKTEVQNFLNRVEKPNSILMSQNTSYETSVACEMLSIRSRFGFKCLPSNLLHNSPVHFVNYLK